MGQSIGARKRQARRGRPIRVRLVGRIEGGAVLSRQAKVRLEMVDWHRANGGSVSRTSRHFGYSRPTVYRWLERFDRFHLEIARGPQLRAAPPPPSDLDGRAGAARQGIRERYPRWGKDKLVVLLRRAGHRAVDARWSAGSCARLQRTGELREPRHRRRMSVPPAALGAAVRCPQAGRLDGRATG